MAYSPVLPLLIFNLIIIKNDAVWPFLQKASTVDISIRKFGGRKTGQTTKILNGIYMNAIRQLKVSDINVEAFISCWSSRSVAVFWALSKSGFMYPP